MNQRLLLVLALAGSLVACSSEANNENSNTVADMGNNNPFVDVDNTGAQYASEYEVVFTSLDFSSQPANKLNMLLNANFDLNLDFPVLILLRLKDIDATAGTLTIEGGSGLKTDDITVFEFDPASDPMGTAGTIDPASGEFGADIDFFGFVATFVYEGVPNKTILPIEGLQIGGQLQLMEDGASADVVNGTLAGYMTKENGDATLITLSPGQDPVSITQVFTEDGLNYDSVAGEMVPNGEGDSWFIDGIYAASATDIAD